MMWVTLGLGSSIDPENQIKACLDQLLLRFHELALSCVFESAPIGFTGDNFLNMVVGFETDMSVDELLSLLKSIEDKTGIDRKQSRFSPRKIDIDLLTYGNHVGVYGGKKLPRPDIVENAYTLWPLSQVCGKRKHPELKQSYQSLWKDYYQEQRTEAQEQLWAVDFEWHGRVISRK